MPILSGITDKIGFLPNVFAILGGNTPALTAFMTLNQQFGASSFTPLEREIIQTAVSVRNDGAYCVAGHSAFAHFQALDEAEIAAVRSGAALSDPRLEALRRFAERLLDTKGRHAEADVRAFLAAGYDADQVYDVILGITVKVFSNLASSVTNIPLDDAFAPFAWSAHENDNE
ncbi:carboxymuconolactone decarboxylase family protein [Halomonas sp. M20]|uniref:carboxymuconolactone decarboxylase family protein n=1 Tax=Halomonas sp. M20 TaxID=2763264 RepID=UPI001D0B09C0|nr:carboxymuconolactone decarboxylase family protein [Halomonas sp. M20]